MKPLYLTAPVRTQLGTCLRPGGATLTRRIVELLAPGPRSIILDAGCGPGASLQFLRSRGVETLVGIDLEMEFLSEAIDENLPVAQADLAYLPLSSSCLDLVFSECAWNLTDRTRVLAEWVRALKPGGHLALIDIYARRNGESQRPDSWPIHCCFAQATDLATIRKIIGTAGLDIVLVEDHSQLLARTAAEFVLEHGSLHKFWQAVTGDTAMATAACTATTASRPGLFLLLARKPHGS
jgi:arsenite methyltransferase